MGRPRKYDHGALLDALELGSRTSEVARRHGVAAKYISQISGNHGYRLTPGRYGGKLVLVCPEIAVPVKPGSHGRRLSRDDRMFIQIRRGDGWSIRRIAAAIGFSPSTVSRELRRRGLLPNGAYSARRAHEQFHARRCRPRSGKLAPGTAVRDQVVAWLNDKFSPRQIQQRLVLDYPDQNEMRVSHETIYQALYVQGRGSLREELRIQKALRSGRTSRRPRSKLPTNFQTWVTGYELSSRPAEAEDRAVPGHWEGDLVMGTHNGSALITLVERSTRYLLVRKVPGQHTAATIAAELIDMMIGLPEHLRQSLTWDQGSEMAEHPRFTLATGTKVYFCDPGSPWQRGSNENTNGLIRDFYPKGSDFRSVPDADIAEMQRLMNIRPRQTLNWKNPTEALAVALTA